MEMQLEHDEFIRTAFDTENGICATGETFEFFCDAAIEVIVGVKSGT